MDDDQQFCLRWNNHQSTLVAVFDTLLENGTLVDCTLAAEGKCLNAHKVVLSACSPYFEALLSKHFDKHPILILKDVKFQELKAMMDYMYRGEVNISQDQLGALLKAAESLQIKGLSDNRKGETERKPAPAPPPPKSPPPTSTLPKVQGLTIEQRSREDSREGSMSPGPRKKKRLRRKSEELDNHDASNSSESHSLPAQNIPASLPAVSKMNADVPEPLETKSEILTRHKQQDEVPQVPIIKEKLETHTELMLEPKSEYVEEMNEDSIEDLTLDDDDLSNMEQMDDQAGPSHGNAGEGSSFGGWHMGNQSQDEVFLAAQEAVGAHRDSQDDSMNTIPTRSKKIYEQAYGELMLWCRNKGIQTISEEVLLAFFTEKSISIKATTLLSKHSMLKNTLATNDNIDIRSYARLNAFLKFKSDDYKSEPANILSREQIDKFLKEAPDKTYLMIKVALIIGLAGACRREELAQLTIDDIQDYGSSLLITIKDPINDKQRSFVVGGSKQRSPNYYAICKKYARLRPPRTNHRRFFICYKKGRCSGEVVGKHVYGMLPRQIASYLDFLEYTKATAAVPKPIFIKTEN